MTTWSIGEAAAKCGLSQHTLRWYERIGLLASIERGGDKIGYYADCLSALHQAPVHEAAPREAVPQATAS